VARFLQYRLTFSYEPGMPWRTKKAPSIAAQSYAAMTQSKLWYRRIVV
jgi:hypothetical protein